MDLKTEAWRGTYCTSAPRQEEFADSYHSVSNCFVWNRSYYRVMGFYRGCSAVDISSCENMLCWTNLTLLTSFRLDSKRRFGTSDVGNKGIKANYTSFCVSSIPVCEPISTGSYPTYHRFFYLL